MLYLNHEKDTLTKVNSEKITITTGETKGSVEYISFEPRNATYGIIFYPGGKVSYEAYAPLMKLCSQKGILCILVKMPGNLAVLNNDAAKEFPELYPNIRHWNIGGHSLGGVMVSKTVMGNHTLHLTCNKTLLPMPLLILS